MNTVKNNLKSFSIWRWAILVMALGLVVFSWVQIMGIKDGLVERRFEQDGTPLLYMVRNDVQDVPGIIVAHGFAGSQQLMLGYGYTFAKAGYGVILLDFAGHATNPNPMDMGGDALQGSIEAAYQVLVSQPEVEPGSIGIAGHSMGSGAAMQAGIVHPERYMAVVALSPTGADVTADLPRNLYLQAGALEPRFVLNAEDLLTRGGGLNDDLANGKGRLLEIIPGVEHITILFAPDSHNQSLDWFNRVFGMSGTETYRDVRMLWYGLHLVGWLLAGTVLGPVVRQMLPSVEQGRFTKRGWLGLVAAPLLAPLVLSGLNAIVDVRNLGGMVVGGALAVWYLILGLFWLGLLGNWKKPNVPALLWGLGLFGFLWLSFGLMAQSTWLAWFLIPRRLVLVPLFALSCMPWQLAFGAIQHQKGFWVKTGMWLVGSIVMMAGFLLTTNLIPGMGVLFLFLPAIPVVLLVLSVAAAIFDHPWTVAVGNALFFAWVIAVLFPLA